MSARAATPAAAWQRRWQGLSARERLGVALALVSVALALAWWLAVAPALKVWRDAPARRQAAEQQLQQMWRLQAQAQALQQVPRLSAMQARQALEASLKTLGSSATLASQAERLTVHLRQTPAPALAAWLAQVRLNARLTPVQARLQRSAVVKDAAVWDGDVVFVLPAG